MIVINNIDEDFIRNTYRTLLTSHADILNKTIKDTYQNVAEQNEALENIKRFVWKPELETIEELKNRIGNLLNTYTDNPTSLENISSQLENIISNVLPETRENTHTPKRGLGKGINPIDNTQLPNNKTGRGVHALIPTNDDKSK